MRDADGENLRASRALAVELAEALQAMVMAAREHNCGLACADVALARARLAGLITDGR